MATDNLGFPFDSINHDRTMSSASFRKLFKSFFTNGIFSMDDFLVMADNSMSVTVGTGNACINGAFYPLNEQKKLTIDNANGTYDRYDAIAIEFNLTDRQFYVKVVKGGSDSGYPVPSRTASVYQLIIAFVKVSKGVTSLVQEDINDVRDNTWYCGYVTSTGSQERFEKELQKFKTQIDNMNNSNTWSEWKTCGKNACGITLLYRYNEALKLCELNWDGNITATIANNTMGYMWEGFPADKVPKFNMFIPVQTQSNDLTLRFYPVTDNITSNHWTLTAMHGDVSNAYICGKYIYSYA
jgi:hypothetical protein